jgi:hypothetical protein
MFTCFCMAYAYIHPRLRSQGTGVLRTRQYLIIAVDVARATGKLRFKLTYRPPKDTINWEAHSTAREEDSICKFVDAWLPPRYRKAVMISLESSEDISLAAASSDTMSLLRSLSRCPRSPVCPSSYIHYYAVGAVCVLAEYQAIRRATYNFLDCQSRRMRTHESLHYRSRARLLVNKQFGKTHELLHSQSRWYTSRRKGV